MSGLFFGQRLMRNIFKKKSTSIKIPEHLAVIMDGNGRWAKRRALPRKAGHRAGAENLRKFIRWCADFNIPYVTVYAFSSENWSRPQDEVNALMKLIIEFFGKYRRELADEGVKLKFIGHLDDLPEDSLRVVKEAEEESKERERITLIIALSYGARQEIVRAVRNMAREADQGNFDFSELNTENFSDFLYTKGIPDPDLLIRSGGEQRISNFLLWQLSYCEFYFCDKLWPDFKKEDLRKALAEFSERERRFGRIQS